MESKPAGKRNLGRQRPNKLPEENKGAGHILGLRVMLVPWAGETESCPHRKSFLSFPCFSSSPFLLRDRGQEISSWNLLWAIKCPHLGVLMLPTFHTQTLLSQQRNW